MYEISLQPCSPQVSHCTVFTLVVSCMTSAFSPATYRSLTTTVFTLVVLCMRSAFSPAAHRSLTAQYLPWWCHVWHQSSVLQPTGPSLKQYLPWWCHVWDQPSVLQPTGLSLHSIYLGGVMYEISLQSTGLSLQQYLPWWCHVWHQPSVLQPTGLSLHSIYLGGVMYEISLQSCCHRSLTTVFTLVVSCMRSAFSPAAHRSLSTCSFSFIMALWPREQTRTSHRLSICNSSYQTINEALLRHITLSLLSIKTKHYCHKID